MSSNTSEPDDGSSADLNGYAYYSFGLSVAVVLLFALITFLLYLYARRNATINTSQLSPDFTPSFRLQTVGDSNRLQVGVDEATLKSYPVMLYSEAKRHRKCDLAATCSICLGDYNESEWLRELPDCGHLFHRKCIDMWLRMSPSCPLCRTSPLPTPVSTPLAEVAALARSGA
ncbi:RING-H2 finger protein ATL70-like [Neltuma alba]|uniref:RING-H2 finger protein ATL70-like n=1 Tax=Neltuma alba TaxID=207710 RepID=UPI0010A426BB|nr:RING-H2 finger protein ATL70-like [Prosopis alba]